jgi:hypothetical protein
VGVAMHERGRSRRAMSQSRFCISLAPRGNASLYNNSPSDPADEPRSRAQPGALRRRRILKAGTGTHHPGMAAPRPSPSSQLVPKALVVKSLLGMLTKAPA